METGLHLPCFLFAIPQSCMLSAASEPHNMNIVCLHIINIFTWKHISILWIQDLTLFLCFSLRTAALQMWFYNALHTQDRWLHICWRKAIGKSVIHRLESSMALSFGSYLDNFSSILGSNFQVDVMIGASFVNFRHMLKKQAKVRIPFHQWVSSHGYLTLVVILVMEDKRMLMSLWG